jgi:hypothetical protein
MISYMLGYKQEDELPEAAVAATKAAVSDLDMPEAIAPVKPAPAPPAPTPPPSLIAVPAAGYEGAVAAGVKKAELSIAKCFVLAIASGTHIAFGAFLALTIGGDCPGIAATDPGAKKMIFGAFGLPFGLFMTVITGSELFTGNAALVPLAYLEGKARAPQRPRPAIGPSCAARPRPAQPGASACAAQATVPQVVKSLVVSWVGNLVGSLFLVWLVHQRVESALHLVGGPRPICLPGPPKARGAPTHPGAPPQQLGGLPRPQEFASGAPKRVLALPSNRCTRAAHLPEAARTPRTATSAPRSKSRMRRCTSRST